MKTLKKIFSLIFLAQIISIFIFFAPAHAGDDIPPDGTLGWWNYVGLGTGYAADPVQACRLSAKNHMGTQLVDMRINENLPDGTSFKCKYPHFLAVGPVYWYASTYLKCKSGYSPKSPGICVINSQPPGPASCSVGKANYVVGNPIALATGGKFQTETDLAVGSLPAMEVRRTYRNFRSFAEGQSGGLEWSFSFDRVFIPMSFLSGHIYTIEGTLSDGNYFKFTWNTSLKNMFLPSTKRQHWKNSALMKTTFS